MKRVEGDGAPTGCRCHCIVKPTAPVQGEEGCRRREIAGKHCSGKKVSWETAGKDEERRGEEEG